MWMTETGIKRLRLTRHEALIMTFGLDLTFKLNIKIIIICVGMDTQKCIAIGRCVIFCALFQWIYC